MQQKIFEKEKSLNLISNRYGLKNFKEKSNQLNKEIDKLEKHLDLLSPKRKIEQHETNVNQALSSLKKSYKRILENKDENIQNIIDKLILLNPLNIMSKGYTVVFQDNKIVTRKSSLNDSSFVLKFYDGEIKAKEVKE